MTLSLDVLKRIPLLAQVSEAMLQSLAQAVVVRSFARRDVVARKGSRGDVLMFLLFGKLQVVDVTPDGREVGLNLLGAGSFFGELSIIDGQPRSASVVALSHSEVALLPREHALDLFYHEPSVTAQIFAHLARSVRQLTDTRTLLGMQNAYQRVYALLGKLTRSAPGGLAVIEMLPTQQEMAIMINTSRETVSRALNELLTQGVVEKDMSRLIIREPARLAEMARSA
ncbi:Crp/Fnr family transcriptional regulator [Thauera aromatica]|uniref:Crp/Fnr family transcriptional regulator n=1 Tax=Thauera aromatica TaxID=59405 RepID=UPI001FFD2DAD|nr:Crp/Fnr family transcriptional regulator [Thauera aromatica]MCK2097399.1 Crp/Fnr family transcriptional regulator [Thauera aromatica]